ncbi:hypothetical protein QG516_20760 [Pedobacter gandavensis]|uniref:hypothetical protein n=1 Tax=Pedobacter gandavensis TaxID=2679963 RepID=UPI00247A2282|nr:hypothetical protein [Pedobacter gandavensis]WGQ08947.1 hypothetical protein QG516_20760 [Pedobacter gandavensis]
MDISKLNNYNSSPDQAFEALSTQLFQRWLYREFANKVSYASVVNGAGGDGGVEAYGVLADGSVVGLQAKYFLKSITNTQRDQIENSIRTAKSVRPALNHYIICFPRKQFSKKKGKGGVPIAGDEESKLLALLVEIKADFPDLQVELWFEDRLIIELTKFGNEGIKRYWFDREEISLDSLRLRFSLAKSGWLQERYVPDLHRAGEIASFVDELMFTPEFLADECSEIREVRNHVQSACHWIQQYTIRNTFAPLINEKLNSLRDKLLGNIELFNILIDDLEHQVFPPRVAEPEEIEIYPFIIIIQQLPKFNTLRDISSRLVTELKRVHEIHPSGYFNDLKRSYHPHNYTILGPVGTGKTHALANAVESRLAEGHGALIIKAKGTNCNSWGSILRQSLDCCIGWSDEEIFRGLEALAIRKNVEDASGQKTGEGLLNRISRILICIDGIDEADDWDAWRTRMLEAQGWLKEVPHVRFMVTARSYPPLSMNPCNLPDDSINQIRVDLPETGDHLLYELVPEYLTAYGIGFDPDSWILEAFGNALTLRLFCELHQGEKITSISERPVNFTLGRLLNIKIDRLEAEFLSKFPGRFTADEKIVRKILLAGADHFTSAVQVEHDELRNRIFSVMDGLVDKSVIGQVLAMLADHAFFQIQNIPSTDAFSPDTKLFGIGIQSYLEYLHAIKYASYIASGHLKPIPASLLDPAKEYIRTLTAVVLFNDHGILIGKDGYWLEDLDNIKLLRLQFAVFKNSSDDKVLPHLDYMKSRFQGSYLERDLVVNEFVLPNIQREKLKLGIDFVHQTLMSFENTYKRDLFWSSPDSHDHIDNSHLSLYLEHHHLYPFDSHEGTPLVMGWSLSSINNNYREHCRSELTGWASYDIGRFIKLLDLLFNCGDPQIQEDLATVIRGLGSKFNKPEPEMRLLVDWILQHIFENEFIVNLSNSVVRYGAFSFMQRAHFMGMCSNEELQQCSPPYPITERLLALNLTPHPLDTAHDGRFPIQDDLGWYVIKNAYDMFLPYETGGLDAVGKVFMVPYELKYEVALNQNQFAVAAAIAYIRSIGWDKEAGPACDGGGEWATFEEKYTHLAVHEIQGYLADRVSYDGYGKEYRLTDYGKLFHVPYPVEYGPELMYHYYHTDAQKWFIPQEIAEPLEFESKATLNQIRDWSTKDFKPDFKKWIQPAGLQLHGSHSCKDDWITLYCSTSFPEPNRIGRSRFRIACVLVDQEEYEDFKAGLQNPENEIDSSEISPEDLRTSISGGVYHSVTEVVLTGKAEEDPQKWISTGDIGDFEVYATVTEVHESKGGRDGEILTIPAKLLRDQLDIRTTDGRGYFKEHEQLVALNFRHQEETFTQQELTVIDRIAFEQLLKDKNLVPVWFAENYRSTMSESKDKDPDDHWQNCTKWVVFNSTFEFVELYNNEHC